MHRATDWIRGMGQPKLNTTLMDSDGTVGDHKVLELTSKRDALQLTSLDTKVCSCKLFTHALHPMEWFSALWFSCNYERYILCKTRD